MQAGGRRATLALIGLLAISAAAGAGWWWWTGPRAWAASERAAASELASFEVCLLGERVDDPDVASRRLRGLVLAGELGAELPEGWPDECAAHLTRASEHLGAVPEDDAARPLRDELARPHRLQWSVLREEPTAYATVRALLASARQAGLPASDATIAPPALPEPAMPLLVEQRGVIAGGDALRVERDGAAGFVAHARTEHARTQQATTAVACATGEGSGADDADLRCSAPHRVDGRASFRLLPRRAASPVRVIDVLADPADARLMDATTWEAAGPYLRVAFVRPELVHGVVLEEPGKPTAAVRAPFDGERVEQAIGAPFPNARPLDAAVRDRFAVIRWEEPEKRTEYRVYAVDGTGAYHEHATFDGAGALRTLCELESGVALVRGEGGRFVVDFAIAAADGDEATRVSHEVEGGDGADVRCLPDGVSFLSAERREGTREVIRTMCGADGCEAGRSTIRRAALTTPGRFELLDLGDRVLAVTGGGDRPVIAVAAPLDALAETLPRVVVDSVAHGGPRVVESMLVPFEDGALLLLRGEDGVRPVVLDATATPRNARIDFAGRGGASAEPDP